MCPCPSGWPCVEGVDAVSDIYQTWLRAEGLLATCQDVYDGNFTKPVFSYRCVLLSGSHNQ